MPTPNGDLTALASTLTWIDPHSTNASNIELLCHAQLFTRPGRDASLIVDVESLE